MTGGKRQHIFISMAPCELRATVIDATRSFQVTSFDAAHDALPNSTASESVLVILGKEDFLAFTARNESVFAIDTPVLLLTEESDRDLVVNAQRAGICEYHFGPATVAELKELLCRWMDCCSNMENAADVKTRVHDLIFSLTDRERDVVMSVVSGKANKEIAADLEISEKTVETHRARAMRKLNATNVSELIHVIIASRLDARTIMHLPIDLGARFKES